AFGFGGTNAHVVLAEAAAAETTADASQASPRRVGPALLTISAAGPEELRALAARYDALLADHAGDAAAICAAAALRRPHEPHRLAVAALTPEALRARLAGFPESGLGPGVGGTSGPQAPTVKIAYRGLGPRRPPAG